MLFGNHGNEKSRQFLFPPVRPKTSPLYLLMEGTSFSCECDYKQSDEMLVSRVFGKGSSFDYNANKTEEKKSGTKSTSSFHYRNLTA